MFLAGKFLSSLAKKTLGGRKRIHSENEPVRRVALNKDNSEAQEEMKQFNFTVETIYVNGLSIQDGIIMFPVVVIGGDEVKRLLNADISQQKADIVYQQLGSALRNYDDYKWLGDLSDDYFTTKFSFENKVLFLLMSTKIDAMFAISLLSGFEYANGGNFASGSVIIVSTNGTLKYPGDEKTVVQNISGPSAGVSFCRMFLTGKNYKHSVVSASLNEFGIVQRHEYLSGVIGGLMYKLPFAIKGSCSLITGYDSFNGADVEIRVFMQLINDIMPGSIAVSKYHQSETMWSLDWEPIVFIVKTVEEAIIFSEKIEERAVAFSERRKECFEKMSEGWEWFISWVKADKGYGFLNSLAGLESVDANEWWKDAASVVVT